MSARSDPATSSSSAASTSAFREWKTPVTSRVRIRSRISSGDARMDVSEQRYRSRRIVECRQLLQFVLGGAGQGDLLAGLINDKAVIRYDHKMPAETEEAADLQH